MRTAAAAAQLRDAGRHPFTLLDGYVPLNHGEIGLYRAIREGVPIVDAAIWKLVRLCGGASVQCQDPGAQRELDRFWRTVDTGWGQQGVQSFLDRYLDDLFTCGHGLGEIVLTPDGREVAALLCADGTVFTGCNVENAAYGSTICAERTALVKAVSEGRRDDFVRLAVAGRSEDYCWPCGSCRQMLYEFAPDLTVLVARGDGGFVTLPLRELLPHGFGPSSLN